MTTTQMDSFTADIASDFAEEVQVADTLLMEIAQANREANYSELTYFAKHLNWNEKQVASELRRMRNVLRERAIAGTPQDRAAAMKEAATASDVLAKEGPKIADQIAKLEAKLRSMESDQRLSAKRCEDQAAACGRLRALVPQHVRDAVRVKRCQIDATLYREILDIGVRINELECCLNRDKYPMTREGEVFYLETVQRCRRDAIIEDAQGGYRKLQLSPQWAQIRSELESELSALQAKVAELQPQYESEIAKIESALDYYVGPAVTE